MQGLKERLVSCNMAAAHRCPGKQLLEFYSVSLLQALPDTEAEVLARLQELEAELRPLAEQKHKIDTGARRCLKHQTLPWNEPCLTTPSLRHPMALAPGGRPGLVACMLVSWTLWQT